MQTKDATEELKKDIRLAEVRHSTNGQFLKEQLLVTYDSLRPANLIKSTLKEVATSPYLISGLAGSIVGLTTGYLSNRTLIGSSAGLLKRFLGNFITLGATSIITKNAERIKSYGKGIFRHMISKRKTDY